MSVRILIGDVFDRLSELADESIHCVVTSPPYWGLRDYGVSGQIGLEPSLGEHLDVMVRVFREVRRVLRKDGTCWMNYGDCYAAAPNGRSAAATKAAGGDDRNYRDKPISTVGPIYVEDAEKGDRRGGVCKQSRNEGSNHTGRVVSGGLLKPKDLCMIPNRLAIALQEDGWWVRSEIVWAKPNPMPESVIDRPATSHEKVFLLTKSARYFYDAAAVLEQEKTGTRRDGFRGENQGPSAYVNQPTVASNFKKVEKADKQSGHGRRHAGFNKRWAAKRRDSTSRHAGHIQHANLDAAPRVEGRNLRNVWAIATRPFVESHFATFPPDLVDPCIKAGCPERGVVLDPFGGAGTVGLVADRLRRDCILIELNPEYAEIARCRLSDDAGMFGQISLEDAGHD